jgi:hypothetical protein
MSLGAALAPLAHASVSQISIIDDDTALHENLAGTLAQMRSMGVDAVRLDINWASIAPDPDSRRAPRFNAANPAAYPASGWAFYDAFVRDAVADGLTPYLTLTKPDPLWAQGPGAPRNGYAVWRPNAREFGQWVRAVATRYDGHYTPPGQSSPLPAVRFWSVWNEPNYGYGLAPQSARGGRVQISAEIYRNLFDQAWSALMATGHRGNTILFGETAPHGGINGGGYGGGGVAPLVWLRALYCVNARYEPLRGPLARANGCPPTPAGSRQFRRRNPGLFEATGLAAHLYAQGQPPDHSLVDHQRGQYDPGYGDLAAVPKMLAELARLQRVYGSHRRIPVYNTEYGYQTRPPQRPASGYWPVKPVVAAYYINWAEYISYRNPLIASYDQYLLQDVGNLFDTGLLYPDGRPKPTYGAFVTPMYMPRTFSRGPAVLEVWGGVRPARVDHVSSAQIQFQANFRGPFRTLRTVPITNIRGYFDVRQRFATSGRIRIAWVDPFTQRTVYSRVGVVRIRPLVQRRRRPLRGGARRRASRGGA